MDGALLTEHGNWFHAAVSATTNACLPNFVLIRWTTRLPEQTTEFDLQHRHLRRARINMQGQSMHRFVHVPAKVPSVLVSRFEPWTRESLSLALSLRFNGHFLGEPGIAGFYWSKGSWRWWWSYKSCKAPVKSSPPTNQQAVIFTRWMPFLSPNHAKISCLCNPFIGPDLTWSDTGKNRTVKQKPLSHNLS